MLNNRSNESILALDTHNIVQNSLYSVVKLALNSESLRPRSARRSKLGYVGRFLKQLIGDISGEVNTDKAGIMI